MLGAWKKLLVSCLDFRAKQHQILRVRHQMDDLLLFLFLYFGALLIPMAYLICTCFRGSLTRSMIIAVLIQLSGALAVSVLVGFLTFFKIQDAWIGWVWLIPVNFVSFIYSLSVFVRSFMSKS